MANNFKEMPEPIAYTALENCDSGLRHLHGSGHREFDRARAGKPVLPKQPTSFREVVADMKPASEDAGWEPIFRG